MPAPILIVEDEFIISMLLERSLKRLGYAVLDKVATGEKAIEAVKRQTPGAILMDIKILGPLDGIETAKAIRAFADVPVVYVTGNSDTMTREKAMRTNPASYLIKPVDLDTLEATLKQIFE